MGETDSRSTRRAPRWALVLLLLVLLVPFARWACPPAPVIYGSWEGRWWLGGSMTLTFDRDGTFTQTFSSKTLSDRTMTGTWREEAGSYVLTPFLYTTDGRTEDGTVADYRYEEGAEFWVRIVWTLGEWVLVDTDPSGIGEMMNLRKLE